MFRLASLFVAFVGGASLIAAPIPKVKSKDTVPDLGEMYDRVGKIVKAGKWPAQDEEKALADTVTGVFQRMVKAAGQKERELPVAIDGLQKLVVEGLSHEVSRENQFVIAGRARSTGMKNCMVFADEIQCTSAVDCILVGKTVRCTSIQNCVIVAEESIQLTVAKEGNSVLCAGQWIRANQLANVLCHIVNPSNAPAPRNLFGGESVAIRCTRGKDSVFLNEKSDFKATSAENSQHLPQKDSIAKLVKR